MKSIIFKLSAVGMFLTHSSVVTANDMNCEKVLLWANKGWALEQHSRGALHKGNRMLKVLEDADFASAFNQSLIDLKREDISAVETTMKTCWQEGRKLMQAASKKGDRAAVTKYSEANNFLRIVFRIKAPERDPANFTNILVHQQALLTKRVQAKSESEQLIKKAKSLTASKNNISVVNSMKQGMFLPYLSQEQKRQYLNEISAISQKMSQQLAKQEIASFDQYEESLKGLEAFLQSRQSSSRSLERRDRTRNMPELEQAAFGKMQQLSEAAITDAVTTLEQFNSSLDGLRKLTAFQQRVMTALRKAKSMGDYRFKKAYKAKLDELAKASLPAFIEELGNYPANEANVKIIKKSVKALFTQRPLPDNIEKYREAASNQAEIMQSTLVKIACYAGISDKIVKVDELNEGLLDDKGSSTLGLFICRLTESRYKLLSYQKPGLMGNTHVLKLKTPRGITLTINMEPLEVNEGEKLLVGKVAKDASEEIHFSLSQWQDYAQQLTM